LVGGRPPHLPEFFATIKRFFSDNVLSVQFRAKSAPSPNSSPNNSPSKENDVDTTAQVRKRYSTMELAASTVGSSVSTPRESSPRESFDYSKLVND
jgi:hypothetical protein